MGQKTDAHHGKDHFPGGADPSYIGWVDLNVSAAVHLANVIRWGTFLNATDQGDGVIKVEVT